MSVEFKESLEVRQLAEEIIELHHPHLKDAKEVIGYYLRDGQSDWAGKCKKCTAFEKHLTKRTFFVFINEDAWRHLSNEQRVALVDHELCHIRREKEEVFDKDKKQVVMDLADKRDSSNWKIREHDVEEFSEIIQRHGLWEQGIESFAVAVRQVDHQMTLDDFNSSKVRKLG
ncbi:putative metallopeptidase [Priestia flexa]|uniref:putative metallopeptidase n=1 Tax=Priestia flexa TaxID=86664 RepID=UPI003F87DA73